MFTYISFIYIHIYVDIYGNKYIYLWSTFFTEVLDFLFLSQECHVLAFLSKSLNFKREGDTLQCLYPSGETREWDFMKFQ